jgi:hypothetical protein
MTEHSSTADRQVIVILADGTRPDVMQALLERGDLPGIARYLLEPAGQDRITEAASVFPTTTGPAHLPFVTGRFPGACNVPGIRWFDPAEYGRTPLSLFRFRSYMGLGNYLAGRDLVREVPTLFELEPDHACIAGNVRRGVRPGRDLTRWGKLANNVQSFFTERWDGMDRLASDKLLQAARQGTRLVFAAFYSPDSMAHKFGPHGRETLDGYRRVDAAIDRLGRWLAQRGRADETLIALVSDHGATSTHTHVDLAGLLDRVAGPCLSHPLIWRGLFDASSAVMVSGNAMAHVYLPGPGGWGDEVTLDEPSAVTSRLLEALLAEEGVEQVIGRAAGGGALAISRRGRAVVRDLPDGRVSYTPEGPDPFGYGPEAAGEHDDRELLRITWETDFPDAPRQALQILDSPRCGHLMVTARPGFDLRAHYEKPAHVGSHGALHALHMRVPFAVNRPLQPGPWRTVDLFPTALRALGRSTQASDGLQLLPGDA